MIDRFSLPIHLNNNDIENRSWTEFKQGLHVIYGESNVGKTELINELAKPHKQNPNSLNNKIKVRVVLQNPDLQIVSNSIQNELAFNLECNSNNSDNIQLALKKLKQNLMLSVDVDRHPVTLSGGEKELLNITTSLSTSIDVILIDDALSFLSKETKDNVVNNLIINYIDDLIILWFTSDENDLQYSNSKWLMTYTSISKIKDSTIHKIPKVKLKTGNANLDINSLNYFYEKENKIFTNYSEIINGFRCLGIVGNNGAGKSTLASLIFGIDKPQSGSIDLSINSISDIKIGYVDQFPEKLLGIMTLSEFISLLINNNLLNIIKKGEIVNSLKMFEIDWDTIKNTLAMDLSWSVIRFSLIIILANCNYDILILDEPTFGMGTNQKIQLQSYFNRYLEEKHLILISHDNRFINSLCDSTIKL